MAKKQSANADPNAPVATKPKRDRKPAEVINLPLRGGIIETIRRLAKVYKVPVSLFMKRFAVEVEPHLLDIARKIANELEQERVTLAASVFESPSVEPVSNGDVPGDLPDHPYPGDTTPE